MVVEAPGGQFGKIKGCRSSFEASPYRARASRHPVCAGFGGFAIFSYRRSLPSSARRGLEFRHFGLRFLNKSLSFSRNLRPAWMRQTFRTDSCAAASAYPARRGGGVAIFSILAVERNDAFGQARCAANKLRAPCCNKRL